MPASSARQTMTVAIIVALVCSLIVSSIAVVLRPRQVANEEAFRMQNILAVAGHGDETRPSGPSFDAIHGRWLDLEAARLVDGDSTTSETVVIPDAFDIAGLGERPRFVEVYLVGEESAPGAVVLPIYGPGLWSTMLGFIALESDGNTVRSLTFYEHGETPGLGDGIAKPAWLNQWQGKLVYDDSGKAVLEVVRGRVDAGSPHAAHQVDGMAGATLTGRGVTLALQYWLGPHGFGPWLQARELGEGGA